LARHRRDDEGVTLVEVLVAFVLLLITVLPLTFLLTSAVSSAADSRQKEAALQLADSWVEILSNSSLPTTSEGAVITNSPQDPSTFPGISSSTTSIPKSTLAGTTFAVTANFTTQSVDNEGQSDLCQSGQPPSQSHPAVILLQVTVSWNNGHNSVTDTTAVDYPQPGLQTQGFLAVQLTNSGSPDVLGNSASDRLAAVPITLTETAQGNATDPWISSSHALTLNPDQNGCVFAQVPVGTYTVSAGQPTSGKPKTFTDYSGYPPFVTTSGNSSDTATTSVTVTAESTVQLNAFDEGITSAISYASSSAVDGGVSCPGTSSITCVTTGNGATGASAAWGGTGSTWSSTTFPNVTTLSQVACTSGSSPTCVWVGYNGSGGVIRTTSSDLGTTSADHMPTGVTITDVTQVACPSANGCYALGTTSGGPVLLAGAVGQTSPQSDTWTVAAPPATTLTSLSSLACPTSTTCEVSGSAAATPVVLRLDGDPASLATNPLWTPTFSTDFLPSDVTSVGTITCPTATLCAAVGLGDPTSSSDPTVLTAAIASGSGSSSTWANESTFPTGATSITGISCTSTTCVAIGTAGGAAAVWTGDLTQSPDDWSAVNVPGSSAVSSVACGQATGNDTADCVLTAATSSGTGQLLVGSLTNGSWSWNSITQVSGSTVRYYVGVACESSPSNSRSTCAAVGATATGPIIATSASGPVGTWTAHTPSSLAGATVTGIPLETAPASTTNWTPQVAAGANSNATTLPNVLYPQPGGYSVVAGDCPAEAQNAWAQASLTASPGSTAPTTSTTVPLGQLPLQVVSSTGAPVGGATVTLTSTTCGGPGGDTYVLPVTDADGLTQSSVPFGTYSYTVTSNGVTTSPSGPVTLNVSTNSVIEYTNGVQGPTTYLPGPVVVSSS
jgi:Tfp pilus assembly protein PilV